MLSIDSRTCPIGDVHLSALHGRRGARAAHHGGAPLELQLANGLRGELLIQLHPAAVVEVATPMVPRAGFCTGEGGRQGWGGLRRERDPVLGSVTLSLHSLPMQSQPLGRTALACVAHATAALCMHCPRNLSPLHVLSSPPRARHVLAAATHACSNPCMQRPVHAAMAVWHACSCGFQLLGWLDVATSLGAAEDQQYSSYWRKAVTPVCLYAGSVRGPAYRTATPQPSIGKADRNPKLQGTHQRTDSSRCWAPGLLGMQRLRQAGALLR